MKEHGLVWIWGNNRFRIWEDDFNKIEAYLQELVRKDDDLIFQGFHENDVKVKGKTFLVEGFPI